MFALTDRVLADFVGKTPNSLGRYRWTEDELPQIKSALRVLSNTAPAFLLDLSDFKSKFPNWMNLAIADALAPKALFFRAANFPELIEVPRVTPESMSSGPVTFKTYEIPAYTLVQMSSFPKMLPAECSDIVPPALNPNKGIILDTKSPTWIGSTVARAYAKHAPWVACTQLGGPCVVVISNNREMPVGRTFLLEKMEEIIQLAAENISPKRGEIWRFRDEYANGESIYRPGLIMSPDDRNRNLVDVLLVPFTRSGNQPSYRMLVPRSVTGLESDSYAACSNISRVLKDKLQEGGPVGRINDEAVMEEILLRVSRALGAQ